MRHERAAARAVPLFIALLVAASMLVGSFATDDSSRLGPADSGGSHSRIGISARAERFAEAASFASDDPYLFVNSTYVIQNDSLYSGGFNAFVGWDPQSFLQDPINGLLYAAVDNTNSGPGGGILLVNLTTQSVVGVIPFGSTPNGLAFDNRSGTIFASGVSSSAIAEINATTNSFESLLNVSAPTASVVFDSANDELYLTDLNQGTVLAVNASSGSSLATIPVGGWPASLGLDPETGLLYVSNDTGVNMTVIDTSTNAIAGELTTPIYTQLQVVDSATDSLFVNSVVYHPKTGLWGGEIVQMSLNSGLVASRTNVSWQPEGMALDPASGILFVGSQNSSSVAEFNATSGHLKRTVSEPYSSGILAFVPDPAEVVDAFGAVSDFGILNTSSGKTVATVEIGAGPAALSYDPTLNRLYVEDIYNDDIEVFNETSWTEIGTIPVSAFGYSQTMVYDPVQDETWVVNESLSEINVINDSRDEVVANVSLPSHPDNIAFDTAQDAMFVTYDAWNHFSVVNASNDSISESVYLPTPAYESGYGGELAYDPIQGEMIVGNLDDYQIDWVNDTNDSIVGVTTLPYSPESVGFDPISDEAYVGLDGGSENQLAILNALNDSQSAQITVGTYPEAIVFDANAQSMVVVDSYTAAVTIVNSTSNRVEATVDVPGWPTDASYNPSTGDVYVATSSAGTIVMLTPGYYVAFNETGLTPGTTWSVYMGGTQLYSTGSQIDIDVGGGTYNYSIGPVAGWVPSNVSGNVTVDGPNVVVVVSWTPVSYPVSFREAGLPVGAGWWLNLSNGATFYSDSDFLNISEPNGSYGFELQAADSSYEASGGQFVVNGSATSVRISFVLHIVYDVLATETGLPNASVWWINLTNGQSFRSESTSISFSEPNGTYSYAPADSNLSFDASSGSFQIAGQPDSIRVTFTEVTYAVTFEESGLTEGTSWSVELGSATQTSDSPTIQFDEPNGTYPYVVEPVPGWYETGLAASAEVAVRGAPVTETPAQFARTTYTVTVTESGLPSPVSWWLNLSNGGSVRATGDAVTILEPNGTYAYSIGTSTKSYAASGGSLTVSGGPAAVSVSFRLVTYAVVFTEEGLPSGATWWLNLTGGTSYSTDQGSISFDVPNGTYDFSVASPGWVAGTEPQVFQVDGSALTQTLTFSQAKYDLTFAEAGLPSGTTWSVTLGGQSESTGSASITFLEPNATYSYVVGSVPGFNSSLTTGTITLDGQSQTDYVVFTANSGLPSIPPSSSAGSSSSDVILIGVGVAVGAIVVAAVAIRVRRRRAQGHPQDSESDEPPVEPT